MTAGAADLPVFDAPLKSGNVKPLSASDIEEALMEQFTLDDENHLMSERSQVGRKDEQEASDALVPTAYSFMMTTDDKPIEHEYEFEFPEEVLHKIFAFLDFKTLCKVCSVSKVGSLVSSFFFSSSSCVSDIELSFKSLVVEHGRKRPQPLAGLDELLLLSLHSEGEGAQLERRIQTQSPKDPVVCVRFYSRSFRALSWRFC